MNLLLDTHAFLWWIGDEPIPARVRAAIANPANVVWLSAASAWEITIKAATGKLRLPDRAARFVEEQRVSNQFQWLPIEANALDVLQDLPLHHRDPFDRLLIAQAIANGCALVSADEAFANYAVQRLWA